MTRGDQIIIAEWRRGMRDPIAIAKTMTTTLHPDYTRGQDAVWEAEAIAHVTTRLAYHGIIKKPITR